MFIYKNFKRRIKYLSATLLIFLIFTSTSQNIFAQTQAELSILFTSNVHGYALPQWDKNGNLINIGYPIFKSYADSVETKNKLLLDTGGLLSGHQFANVQHGLFPARLLSQVKYDAIAVGKHDLDYGPQRLVELANRYDLNFIAANIHKKEDGTSLFPPYIIKDFNGLKVGIFALISPEAAKEGPPDKTATLSFNNPSTLGTIEGLAQDISGYLRKEGAQLIIALTHLGVKDDKQFSAQELAQKVPGIDLIIDGHGHSEMSGLKVGKSLIVSPGAYFNNIGRVDVSRDNKGVSLKARLVDAAEASLSPPDPELDALSATIKEEFGRDMEAVIATIPFDLEGGQKENKSLSTNLGRLICESLKKSTGADVAIINSGLIQNGLLKGEVKRKDIAAIVSPTSYAYSLRLSGAELIEIINHGLGKTNESAFPQFYGMTITAFELKKEILQAETKENTTKNIKEKTAEEIPSGGRVDIIEIGGRQLDKEREYTIAVNDYIYKGGDGYDFSKARQVQEFIGIDELLIKFFAESSVDILNFINQDDVLTVLIEE